MTKNKARARVLSCFVIILALYLNGCGRLWGGVSFTRAVGGVDQAFEWLVQLGETGKSTQGMAAAVDSSQNSYVGGYTTGNLPSCGGVSASCAGNSQGTSDYFISKYSSNSSWLWTQQLGETAKTTQGLAISVDSSQSVYITGYTTGNLASCAGVSAACAGNSQGTQDYFISKYSSSGAWSWTVQLGETAKIANGTGIVNDASSNVIITGLTSGNLVSCGGVSAACAGNAQGINDYFISKYTSGGVWSWTIQLGETAKNTQALGVAADSSSNIVVTGQTDGNLVSCGGVSAACAGNSQGLQDYFISQYTSAGAWVWTKQLGETLKFAGTQGVVIDSSSNIYVAGYADGNLVSCNGVSASCAGSAQGTQDYIISKYTSTGAWVWTKQLGETAKTATANGISVDSSSNIYVVGYTNGNFVSCNGASASCSGSSQGSQDYFVSKYSSSGAWVWTQQLGETGKVTLGQAIAVDSSQNVHVVGYTTGNLVSCNGISASCSGSSQGAIDYIMSRY